MADDRMGTLDLLRKVATDGDLDFLREGLTMLSQLVMDAAVRALVGLVVGVLAAVAWRRRPAS